MSELFRNGSFDLHSGGTSSFKIDCDFLTDNEIAALADQIVQRVGRFGSVEGVPTGGLRLAQALAPYACVPGPLLIVDDVLSTGASMEDQRRDREAIGWVLFARKQPTQDWIRALFTMAALEER